MEELSKQISIQLNESIYVSGDYLCDDKNNIKIYYNKISDITAIIQIYNELKEYKNNINKEYDLEYCCIQKNINDIAIGCEICSDENNINATNYIELTEKIKKIVEKNRLEEEEIMKEWFEKEKRITIELSKILKEDVVIERIYNNSFIILGQCANTEYKIKIEYHNIGDIPKFLHIDPIIPDIPNIFPNIPNSNIINIFNTVKRYINLNLNLKCYFETYYTQTNSQFYITKFFLKCDDYEFSGKNYIECNQKIVEYVKMNELKLKEQESIKLKKEQEKEVQRLKSKYGNKTDRTITCKKCKNNIQTLKLDLTISDMDQYPQIDLLDFIPNYQENIIINGFIKKKNNVNYEDIKNKSEYKCDLKDISKYILNITIQNCPNLKIINNIIYFEKICNLKIVNCPKLEFIENYNNFSEIYVDNRLIKVVNE
jgi:hypothetical protein